MSSVTWIGDGEKDYWGIVWRSFSIFTKDSFIHSIKYGRSIHLLSNCDDSCNRNMPPGIELLLRMEGSKARNLK